MKYLKLFEEFSFPVAPVMEGKEKGEPFDIELARATLEKWNNIRLEQHRAKGFSSSFSYKKKDIVDRMVKELDGDGVSFRGSLIVAATNFRRDCIGKGNFEPGEKEDRTAEMSIIFPGIKQEDIWYKYQDESDKSEDGFIKRFEEIKKLSEDEARKRLEDWINQRHNKRYSLGMQMHSDIGHLRWVLLVWNSLLSESEKEIVAQELVSKATGLGWDKNSWNKRVLELEPGKFDEKFSVRMNQVNSEQAKKELPASVTPPTTTAMLEPSQSSKVFKVNRTGENGAEDYEDDTLKGLADNLGAIFQRLLTGEIAELRSIIVSTSCDRYRNTGEAENLTWGQLAYARALSLSSLVLEVAKKSGIPQPKIEALSKAIKINFKGENGDGTSGPNPISPKTFGYYDKSGKYVNLKDAAGAKRNEIQVVPIDDEGNPTSVEPKSIDKSKEFQEMKDADSYDKFRYSNVIIEYVKLKEEDKQNKPNVMITYKLSYPVGLNVPERFRGRKITIPIPTITFGLGEKSTKKSSTSCDNGKGGIKSVTRFGLTIKPVTLSSWQSEIK